MSVTKHSSSFYLTLFSILLAAASAAAGQTIPFDGHDVQVVMVDRGNWAIDSMWMAAHRQAAIHEEREFRAPKGQKVLEIRLSFKRNADLPAPSVLEFEKSRNLFNPKSIARMPRSKFRVEDGSGKVLEWGGLGLNTSVNSASPLAAAMEADRLRGRTGPAANLDIRDVVSQIVSFNKDFSSGWTQLLFVVPPDFDTETVKVFLDGQQVPRKPAKQKK